jgi:hypothetical protein
MPNVNWANIIIIIIMLPNQAIASTPSAPRPSGADMLLLGRHSIVANHANYITIHTRSSRHRAQAAGSAFLHCNALDCKLGSITPVQYCCDVAFHCHHTCFGETPSTQALVCGLFVQFYWLSYSSADYCCRLL